MSPIIAAGANVLTLATTFSWIHSRRVAIRVVRCNGDVPYVFPETARHNHGDSLHNFTYLESGPAVDNTSCFFSKPPFNTEHVCKTGCLNAFGLDLETVMTHRKRALYL